MSLRKSPTLTVALLEANRRNAALSTGPRTRRGKAVSRMNRFRHGGRSRQFAAFVEALAATPPGYLCRFAKEGLPRISYRPPLFRNMAEAAVQAEIELCGGTFRPTATTKKNSPQTKPECH